MNRPDEKISAVPANVITGFLGVGKTSAILHLLKTKPDNQRWAVLVNEFGEIGVDGSLFQGQHSEEQQVYIREVPGGCMCCAAGLPMQVALNQLLSRAKPHRLLIEPTGLGHPLEVLEALTQKDYRELLSIQKTITLVDARKLDDPRYTGHETFNQQIAIADIIVGNKQDLYTADNKARLEQYAKSKASTGAEIVFTQHGMLSAELLDGVTAATTSFQHDHRLPDSPAGNSPYEPMPECGYLKAENQGEGFHSVGWRFDPRKTFSWKRLNSFLSGIVAERMKAVFITDRGIFGYNLTSDSLTEIELDECPESRIEIIATELNEHWEQQLLACVKDIGPGVVLPC